MTSKTSFIRGVINVLKGHTAVWALLVMTSCAGAGPVPNWDGSLWPGHPELGAVQRVETDGTVKTMLCTDPKIKHGSWVSHADLRKVFVIIQSCRQWKQGLPMMTAREALRRFRPVIEDLEREAVLEEAGIPPQDAPEVKKD